MNVKGPICDDLLVSIDSDSKIPDHKFCPTPGNDEKLTSQHQATFSSMRPAVHRTSKTATGQPPCANNEQPQRSDRFPRRQRYKQKKRLIDDDTWELLCMPPPVHSRDSTTQCMPVDFYDSESALFLSNSVFSTVESNLNPLAPPFIPDSDKQSLHVFEVSDTSPVCDSDFSALCDEFSSLFDHEQFLRPTKHKTYHYIRTTGPPCSACVRWLSPEKLEILCNEVDKLLDLGFIKESDSPCGRPVHLVPKPGGKRRITCDYRALNSQTVADTYSLPLLTDFVYDMSGSTIFSSV